MHPARAHRDLIWWMDAAERTIHVNVNTNVDVNINVNILSPFVLSCLGLSVLSCLVLFCHVLSFR